MKHLLIALIVLMSMNTYAQSSDFDIVKDKKSKALIYKGQCTFDDLLKQESFSWLPQGAANYNPDTAATNYLRKNLPHYQLVVFIGTWCDDTYTILPKLFKVLQVTGYPMSQYLMYGVDRNKATKYIEAKLYKIQNVPTIIVFRGNIEVGRIKETLNKSVEKDLAAIVDMDMTRQEVNKQSQQQQQQ